MQPYFSISFIFALGEGYRCSPKNFCDPHRPVENILDQIDTAQKRRRLEHAKLCECPLHSLKSSQGEGPFSAVNIFRPIYALGTLVPKKYVDKFRKTCKVACHKDLCE